MYAIFRLGSKQYRAEKGDTLELDRQGPDEGAKVEFDEVLVYHDGKSARIGAPTLPGVKVLGEIVKNLKGEKIRVVKYRRREKYRRAKGHRSRLSLVKITDIVSG